MLVELITEVLVIIGYIWLGSLIIGSAGRVLFDFIDSITKGDS